MKNWLFFIAVFAVLFISACATFEPDDGRHYRPPQIRFHPYEPPPNQLDISTDSYVVVLSGYTYKNP